MLDATKSETTSTPSTLAALGNHIKSDITKADSLRSKSDAHLQNAGRRLLEAHERIKADKAMTWAQFLTDHCGGLSRQRAAELMDIAGGKVTVEQSRERARTGMAKSRAAKRAETRDGAGAPVVRNVTDTARPSRLEAAIAAYNALTEDERVQFLETLKLKPIVHH